MAEAPQFHEVCKISGHKGDVNGAYYLSDLNLCVSIAEDKTIRLWRVKENEQTFIQLQMHQTASHPSCLVYNNHDSTFYVGLKSGTILFFSLDMTGTPRLVPNGDFEPHRNRVTAIAIDNERHLIISVSRDKYLTVYNYQDGSFSRLYVCSAWLSCLTFDTDAKIAYCGAYNRNIYSVDISNETNPVVLAEHEGHRGSIRSLIFDRVEKRLFSGSFDNTIICWAVNDGLQKGQILMGHQKKIKAMLLLRDNMLLSTGDDKKFFFFDLDDNTHVECQGISRSNILNLSFHEGYVCSGGCDKIVHIWKFDL
ncbi:hypothetical protein PCE1_000475 [Barthelona sp. PCE]